MTKAEIMIKLKEGYRVTHTYFSKHEYIQLVDFKLLDEEGRILNWKDFWAFRRDRMFDNGWELYHEPESRGIAGVYENAIGPQNPDIIITEAQPEEPVNVTLTDYSKMPELAPEPEYIQETGSMPILEWLLNLFRRKSDRPRKLTKRQRMDEYERDNEPIG